MAQNKAMKDIEAEEIAQAQKKAQEKTKSQSIPVFRQYGALQAFSPEEGVNSVAEKEKEKQKSFQTYQYCVDKQGGKLSCAGRLGTPPEILAMANNALMKMAKKASYCEKRKAEKACQKLPNVIAINKRRGELKAKEIIVASNNLL